MDGKSNAIRDFMKQEELDLRMDKDLPVKPCKVMLDKLRDNVKQEDTERGTAINVSLGPCTTLQTKQEVVSKLEVEEVEKEEEEEEEEEEDDTDSNSSSVPMIQCGQEEDLVIYQEEIRVLKTTDALDYISEEPREEVSHHDAGTCSVASELVSCQQPSSETSHQPSSKACQQPLSLPCHEPSSSACQTKILNTRQDCLLGESEVQAASHATSEACKEIFSDSRLSSSANGKSYADHTRFSLDIGSRNLTVGETERKESSEETEQLSPRTEAPRVPNEQSVVKSYSCSKCSKMFSKKCQLKEHLLRTHKEGKSFECCHCEEEFVRRRDLEYHVKIRHRSIYKATCECGELFSSPVQFSRHKRTCKGKRVDQCGECEKEIPKDIDLTKLMSVHDADRPLCSGYVKISSSKAFLSTQERNPSSDDALDILNDAGQRHGSLQSGDGVTESAEFSSESEDDQDIDEGNAEECDEFYDGCESTGDQAGVEREETNENPQNDTVTRDSSMGNDDKYTESPDSCRNVARTGCKAIETAQEDGKTEVGEIEGQKCAGFHKSPFPETDISILDRQKSVATEPQHDCLIVTDPGVSKRQSTGNSNSGKENAYVSKDERETNVTESDEDKESSDKCSEQDEAQSLEPDSAGHAKAKPAAVRARPYSCSICKKRYLRSDHLTRHMYSHSAVKPFQCQECERGFTRNRDLKIHVAAEHWEIFSQVCECGERYRSEEELAAHRKIHSGDHHFYCIDCKKSFATNYSYSYHMKMHREKRYRCAECEQVFAFKGQLDVHIKTHPKRRSHKHSLGKRAMKKYPRSKCLEKKLKRYHQKEHKMSHGLVRPIECPECRKGFSRRRNLTLHLMRIHWNIYNHLCECGERFRSEEDLAFHKRLHVQQYPAECPDCKKTFSNRFSFTFHLRMHQEKPYKCSECEQVFGWKSELATHMVMHTKGSPYQCPQCKLIFLVKRDFLRHVTMHSTLGFSNNLLTKSERKLANSTNFSVKDPYDVIPTDHSSISLEHRECSAESSKLISDVSKKTLKAAATGDDEPRESTLSSKSSSMPNERGAAGKKYSCIECGKVYRRKGSLKEHCMFVHKKQMPFSCPECHKGYKSKRVLMFHLQTVHGNIFSKVCDCGDRFRSKEELTLHKRIHYQKYPAECPHCKKMFSNSISYTCHLKRHSKKPYKCSECDEAFGWKWEREAHMKTHKEKSHQCLQCKMYFLSQQACESHTCMKAFTVPQLSDTASERNPAVVEDLYDVVSDSDRNPANASLNESCDVITTDRGTSYNSEHRERSTGSGKLNPDVSKETPKAPESNVKERNELNEAVSSKSASSHAEKQKALKKLFSCPECPQEFTTKRNLTFHLQRWHGNIFNQVCECGQRFHSQEELAFHKRIHHQKYPVECPDCKKTFIDSLSFAFHITMDNGQCSQSSECEQAASGWDWERDTHMETHPKERSYQCSHCQMIFSVEHDFRRHVEMHTNDNLSTVSGKDCSRGLNESSQRVRDSGEDTNPGGIAELTSVLDESNTVPRENMEEEGSGVYAGSSYSDAEFLGHEHTHHEGKSFECQECETVFTDASIYDVHMKMHGKILKCPECEEAFNWKGELKAHIRKTHTADKTQCLKCSLCFLTEEDCLRHMQTHSENTSNVDQEDGCDSDQDSSKMSGNPEEYGETCTDTVEQSDDVKEGNHKMGENDSEQASESNEADLGSPWDVEILSVDSSATSVEEFGDVLHKSNQELSMTDDGQDCSEGKAVTREQEIREQTRSNKRQSDLYRPEEQDCVSRFPCPKCDKKYKRIGDLKVHMYSHTTEWPFSCPHCGKGYTHRMRLKLHLQLQHGETAVEACECGKVFFSKAELLCHKQASHSRREAYQCLICERTFFEYEDYKDHLNMHREYCFKCPECNLAFGDERQFTEHLQMHVLPRASRKLKQQEKHFKCTECGQGFDLKTQLNQHMRVHAEGKPFLCSICNSEFSRESDLEVHKQSHVSKFYGCDECGEEFATEGRLRAHTRKHKNKSDHRCPQCGKRLSTEDALKTHLELHKTDTSYECPKCQKQYDNKSAFVSHVKRHKEKIFQCSECTKRYRTKSDLKRHMKVHAGLRPFKCTECDKAYIERSELTKHMRKHDQSYAHLCHICGKTMSSENSLQLHINTHKRDIFHACPSCGLDFTNKVFLFEHLKKCTEGKPYLCTHSQCQERFATKHEFNRHMKWHSGKNQCTICKRRFKSISHLQQHIRTHTGERPFECNQCHQRFLAKGALLLHERRHAGIKPFECPLCGTSFIAGGGLRRHLKKVHKEEKYCMCHKCGMRFSSQAELSSHRKPVKGEMLYQCSECREKFSQMCDMAVHFKTHSN